MKFIRIELQKLRNEEWFQLFTEFKDLVELKTSEVLDIVALFIAFLAQYSNADQALEFMRKSPETEPMHAADRKRDTTFRGIWNAIKSATKHFDPAKREAARELDILLSSYGNLAKKAGDEETAAIYNFIQELRGKFAQQTALLDLSEWVDELERNNDAYEVLVKARSADIASRTKYRMFDVRKDADTIYYSMVERMEAKMVLDPNDTLASFINEFNVFLKERKDIDAQRKGQRNKTKLVSK